MTFSNVGNEVNQTSTGVFRSMDDTPFLSNLEDEKLWQAEHRAFEQIAEEKLKMSEIDSLWGSEPTYTPTDEEKAGWLSQLTFHWMGERVRKAASGDLVISDLVEPSTWCRSFRTSRVLSSHLHTSIFHRHSWDSYIGCTVQYMGESDTRGQLRWIGYLQQSDFPRRLLAGVEWEVAPRHRRHCCLASQQDLQNCEQLEEQEEGHHQQHYEYQEENEEQQPKCIHKIQAKEQIKLKKCKLLNDNEKEIVNSTNRVSANCEYQVVNNDNVNENNKFVCSCKMEQDMFVGPIDDVNNSNHHTSIDDVDNCTLHDGVVHGERLFTPSYLISEIENRHRVNSFGTVERKCSGSNKLESDRINIYPNNIIITDVNEAAGDEENSTNVKTMQHTSFTQRSDNQHPPSCSCEPITHIELIKPLSSHALLPPYPSAPSLIWSLFSSHPYHVFIQFPTQLLYDMCVLASPVILEWFIAYLSSDSPTWYRGLSLVFLYFIVSVVGSCANQKYQQFGLRAMVVFQTSTMGVIFEKCLTIARSALQLPEMSIGRVINMCAKDVYMVAALNWYVVTFVSAPLRLILAIVLLYRLVGYCAFAGIIAAIVIFPVQGLLSKRTQELHQATMLVTDRRVKYTNELLSGIATIKMMGWERRFLNRIEWARREELRLLRKLILNGIYFLTVDSANPIVSLSLVFVLYHLTGNELTPGIVFPTMVLLETMHTPFYYLTVIFPHMMQAIVSSDRITSFLECNDRTSHVQNMYTESTIHTNAQGKVESNAVIFDTVEVSTSVPVELPRYRSTTRGLLSRAWRFLTRRTLPEQEWVKEHSSSEQAQECEQREEVHCQCKINDEQEELLSNMYDSNNSYSNHENTTQTINNSNNNNNDDTAVLFSSLSSESSKAKKIASNVKLANTITSMTKNNNMENGECDNSVTVVRATDIVDFKHNEINVKNNNNVHQSRNTKKYKGDTEGLNGNNKINKKKQNDANANTQSAEADDNQPNLHHQLIPKILLENISLQIPEGKLTLLLGATGSGKSTLLLSILGQYEITKGHIWASKNIAYVPQEPWIMNETLRNNILFFNTEDTERLHRSIAVSQLTDDLHLLNGGLETEIGEKGVNLSGGQKARVNVARAVYSNRSVYLLDDPLSALDAHVGEKMMNECILGTLHNKTRILATHQSHLYHHADNIIVLDHGQVKFTGTYEEYEHYKLSSKTQSLHCCDNIIEILSPSKEEENTTLCNNVHEHECCNSTAIRKTKKILESQKRVVELDDKISSAEVSTADKINKSANSCANLSLHDTKEDSEEEYLLNNANKPTHLVDVEREDATLDDIHDDHHYEHLYEVNSNTSEERASGCVPWSTYWVYIKACGGFRWLVVLVALYAITELVTLSKGVWLSIWSVGSFHLQTSTYLDIYLIIAASALCVAPLRGLFGFSLALTGSKKIHDALLYSITAAKMEFFYPTPIGRIINRFSRDLHVVDTSLNSNCLLLVSNCFSLFSSLTLMSVAQPLILIALIPCACVYCYLIRIFAAAMREMRRVKSLTYTPVVNLIEEILSAKDMINIYGKSSEVLDEAKRRLDVMYSGMYNEYLLLRWLGLRLDIMSAIITTCVAFVGVLGTQMQFSRSSIGLISFSFTTAMELTQMLNWFIQQAPLVEADMNSMERVFYYIDNIKHEPLDDIISKIPALLRTELSEQQHQIINVRTDEKTHQHEQPIIEEAQEENSKNVIDAEGKENQRLVERKKSGGTLSFCNVNMRYREGLPLVLRNVTFSIAAREKVGIVGRTGSGKSTLLLTFMRMVDICDGQIIINDKPIHEYHLRELRRLFSMIPQDPVLFDGTVRLNVDPFLESTSEEIWHALELVGLKSRIESECEGIDSSVQEGGANFSVGQRQLLCMARALLKHGSKFILMDEATANVDQSLDRVIQNTVMTAFADYTVITIAHRLHTIASYDKIIVMDGGQVAEIGSPKELVSRSSSHFNRMVRSLGDTESVRFYELLRSV